MPAGLPTHQYSPDDTEPLSTAIITALSEAKGRDITHDECVLYDSIDPEALEGLFRQPSGGDTVKVEFTTHDAVVIIWGNGERTIQVEDLEADPNHE